MFVWSPSRGVVNFLVGEPGAYLGGVLEHPPQPQAQ